ncbi:Zinc finger, RING-type, partial [Dillenia turbinata]
FPNSKFPARKKMASSNQSSATTIDQSLLISASSDENDWSRRSNRRRSLREAVRFLRRASSRRMMREPSMIVRETAAEQLEERQSDWAYSKPVVILDIIWNLAFIVVAMMVMGLSRFENPVMPLRLWIVGYSLQCLLHIVCVFVEYRRRRQSVVAVGVSGVGGDFGGEGLSPSSRISGGYSDDNFMVSQGDEDGGSMAKHLESANTMFSFIWWIIGFYWVSAGGPAMAHDSPQLYWLCVMFLAFDVFFVVFCVALACVIGIAVCCCLPCIIALLYAVADQEGASKEDVEQLPKYKFRSNGNSEKLGDEIQLPCGGVMTECSPDAPNERNLSEEDAECCICLSAYEDGVELRELPCGHHFHCSCVDKWLHINATCPLCKYNILKSCSNGPEQV